MSRVVVLVPRRVDGGHRDAVWAWIRARWERVHPEWPVIEGHHDDGPFNRSAAINEAARAAGDWDIAVIADADTFVPQIQVLQAVAGAQAGPCRFWLAYNEFRYLTPAMSTLIMRGRQAGWDEGVEWTMAETCSSQVVVTRGLWDLVGGFDEGFRGWGFEDVAFSHAAQVFGGGLRRVPGPAWHLWHPLSAENSSECPEWQANLERMHRYGDVAGDRRRMGLLLDEFGVRP